MSLSEEAQRYLKPVRTRSEIVYRSCKMQNKNVPTAVRHS